MLMNISAQAKLFLLFHFYHMNFLAHQIERLLLIKWLKRKAIAISVLSHSQRCESMFWSNNWMLVEFIFNLADLTFTHSCCTVLWHFLHVVLCNIYALIVVCQSLWWSDMNMFTVIKETLQDRINVNRTDWSRVSLLVTSAPV